MRNSKLSLSHYEIIKTPVVTEKSTMMGEHNKYIFEVHQNSDKQSISNAVSEIFKVKVKKVNIINQQGKTKRFKGRIGKRSDMKKAMVTLEQGDMIDFTGGIN